jgi:hypothetical protein
VMYLQLATNQCVQRAAICLLRLGRYSDELWHFLGDEATAIFRYHICGETALTTARSAVGVAIIST